MQSRSICYFLLLFVGCAATQSVAPGVQWPIVGRPLNAISTREVVSAFASLLQLAGYGFRTEERAAFVVLSEDDTLHLIVWPPTHRFHHEAWRGAIPAGAVAIVHTHPADDPRPSFHDEKEAQRVGVPIFVLTPQSIIVVSPRDGTSKILARQGWLNATSAPGPDNSLR